MTCFSLSTKSGPRSDDCADTVAFAPGGLESIVTSWNGPWTSVAQPLSAATATTRNVACRVMRNPFPSGRDAPPDAPAGLGRARWCGCRGLPHPRGSRVRSTLLGLPEDRLLEHLRDREPDLLASRDLDRLTGLRIPPHACLHLAEPEDAQAGNLDGLPLLDALDYGLDQTVEHLVGLLATHPTRFCELRHQLRLRHRSTSIPGGISVARKNAPIYGKRDTSVKKTRVYQGLACYRPRPPCAPIAPGRPPRAATVRAAPLPQASPERDPRRAATCAVSRTGMVGVGAWSRHERRRHLAASP